MDDYPTDWDKRRYKVFRRDRWKCQACGFQGGPRGDHQLHAHHIIPKSQGGGHNYENLTTLCDICHAEIHDDQRLLAGESQRQSTSSGGLFGGIFGWLAFGSRKSASTKQNRTSRNSQKRSERRKQGIKQLERKKREMKRGTWDHSRERMHRDVESDYNEELDGCPSCSEYSLEIHWDELRGRKYKVFECTSCHGRFEEDIQGGELILKKVDNHIDYDTVDSALEYEIMKHLELGTIERENLDNFKNQVLEQADNARERKHVHKIFKRFGE